MRSARSIPSRRVLLALGLLALALRVGVFAHNVRTNPEAFRIDAAERERIEAGLTDPSRPFLHRFGFEASNVAWALVCDGQGFASPFGGGTGPTAWLSPGQVGVWALAFAVWGCFTTGSVLAVYAVAAAASAAMVVLGAVAAGRLHRSRSAAVAAGLLLVLSPWDLAVFHSRSLLDPNLLPLAALVLLTLALALPEGPGDARGRSIYGRLLLYAAASAVVVLIHPVLMLPAACTLTLVAWARPGRVPAVPALALFVGALLLAVGPYALDRSRALGTPVFVKSNLPFEIHVVNLPSADGIYGPQVFRGHHPSQNVDEYRAYRHLGERAYVRSRFQRFLEGFDVGRFARATGNRAAHLLFLHTARPWQAEWSVWLQRVLAVVPGLVLLGYPLAVRRRRPLHLGDATVYTFVGAYLVPFLLIGVVERFRLPLFPPVLVLASGMLPWPVSGSRPSRTRTRSDGSDDGANRAPVGSGRFS